MIRFSAVNLYNVEFPCETFYLVSSEKCLSYTGNSVSWVTGNLNGETGSGMVPCAAAVYPIKKSIVIVTGFGDPEELKALSDLSTAQKKLSETIDYWKSLTDILKIKTPFEKCNQYLNDGRFIKRSHAALCGRTYLYQSGAPKVSGISFRMSAS
jgi:hypothetical protein